MDKKNWANTALCVFIGGCVVFAVTNVSSALTKKGLFRHDPQPCGEVAAVVDQIVLREFVNPQPDHKVNAEFFVTNNSDKDVENILVQCDFFDQSGKEFLDREQWLLGGVLKGGDSQEYSFKEKHFIHTGAVNYTCVVGDLDIFEPPLFALHSGAGGHGEGHGAEGATGHGEGHDEGHGAGAATEHGGDHGQGVHH